jgi:sugar/nucleoside kinase (ribokinase family)
VSARVVVIGDALLDVQARHVDPIRWGSDIPAEVRVATGGQGANLAVRLARRGVDVTLVCAVGDDAAGTLVREALGSEGVGLAGAAATTTGIVVVLGGADGERTMLSQRTPFAADAAAQVAAAADWIVVSGYLLLEPTALEMARQLAERPARRAVIGCAVPDPRLDAWREGLSMLRPDILVVNRDELERLELRSPPTALAVTERSGASLTIDGQRVEAAVPPGPPAIDTTGSGDAFAGALLASLVDGQWPPEPGQRSVALGVATAAGSAAARVTGAQARIPGESVATGVTR